MNKLDKQIFKLLDKHFPDEMDSSMYHPNLTEDLVSQIKQSILKAIMEEKPRLRRWDESEWIGYNTALSEFESVIKEVLLSKEKIK